MPRYTTSIFAFLAVAGASLPAHSHSWYPAWRTEQGLPPLAWPCPDGPDELCPPPGATAAQIEAHRAARFERNKTPAAQPAARPSPRPGDFGRPVPAHTPLPPPPVDPLHCATPELMREFCGAVKSYGFDIPSQCEGWLSPLTVGVLPDGCTCTATTTTHYTPGTTAGAAQPADMFVESVGVATHLGWRTSIYSRRFSDVQQAMKELGVRYYRTDGSSTSAQHAAALYSNLGARGVFIISDFNGDNRATGLKAGSAAARIDELASIAGNGVYAVEGPNEYDASGRREWVGELRSYQLEIYNHIKKTPGLQNIIVGGPSLIITATDQGSSRALGDMSDRSDIAVHHDYSYNGAPEARFATSAQLLATNNYGSSPILTTETGVCTNEAGAFCVNEKTQAKYILRNLADKFSQHPLNKSFIYEFIDQGTTQGNAEWDWGIVRSDFTRKPAFHAVKNLITLLSDKGNGSFTPGAMNYVISGDSGTIKQTLLQKSAGRFYLLLWQNVKSYDNKSDTELATPARNVSITFDAPVSVKVFQPTPIDGSDGIAPVSTAHDVDKITVNVPDHVVVAEITPTDKAAIPGPSVCPPVSPATPTNQH